MNKALFFFCWLILGVAAYAQTDSTAFITIRKIIIEGNRKTKDQIITRELSFSEGGTYQRFQLDSMFVWDGNRIYNTNLFNTVDFEIVNQREGFADVVVMVDERWYFYPIPIFRLIDRNFNDWWVNRNRDLSRVNIGLRLTHFNFRGRAERLRTSAQFGFETRVNFNYRIPYIEKTQKHGLTLDFNYIEAKNLAYDTENNIRTFLESEDLLRTLFRNSVLYSYRSSFYSFHFFSLGHSSVHVADTIVSLNPNYFLDGASDQKYVDIAYGYEWDKRNNLCTIHLP